MTRIDPSDLPEWERDLLEKQTVAGERIGVTWKHVHDDYPVIAPEDIRPGDVVRVVCEMTCDEVTDHGTLISTGGRHWLTEDPIAKEPLTWLLVHRPDPDAEVIEALAKVMHDDRCAVECCDGCDMGDYEHDAERIIHSARERGWDVVRRQP